MLDQSYVLGGKLTTIVAPTTCVLRPEFVNDDETPGDVNLVSAIATFC